jgi:hypothetical protein
VTPPAAATAADAAAAAQVAPGVPQSAATPEGAQAEPIQADTTPATSTQAADAMEPTETMEPATETSGAGGLRSGGSEPTLRTAPATPADNTSVDVPSGDANPRTEAWAKIIADPGHSPELLALAAVQTIGPRAKEWADRVSDAYPSATSGAKARLAVRQFTRFGGLSSVFAAVAGSYAPFALLGAAALTHADLALHIAAAYGLDPTDERRAAELLMLTKVHPSRDEAEGAINTAKQPAYEDEEGGVTEAAWRLGRMVAAQAGGWTVIRTINRFFPGTSLLAAVLTSRSAAQALAARAERLYSKESRHSQESQAFGKSV